MNAGDEKLRRPRVALADYGMGNRRSVQKALERAGAEVAVSSNTATLNDADGIVVPGVGAFPLAMRNLGELGLDAVIRERAAAAVPVLGICLGMQLLFEYSEELQPTAGLGLLDGAVTALRSGDLRVPHIGWNEVEFERQSTLIEGLPERGCAFYHVHSFAARPARSTDVLGSTEYGERFATIVARDNVFGAQFHPEKSSAHGLLMLGNFIALCRTAARAAVRA